MTDYLSELKIQSRISDLLARRSLSLNERKLFMDNGYVHLTDLWDSEFSAALKNEARTSWDFSQIPKKGPRTKLNTVNGGKHKIRAATGKTLKNLHFAMLSHVRALTGRLLVPTFSAYGYYESNDKTLLHIDEEDCDITLLTVALGQVGPLHLHPELSGMTMEELGILESDEFWNHSSGIQITYPEHGFTVILGNKIPHNRPGKAISELCAVAALCYRSLF